MWGGYGSFYFQNNSDIVRNETKLIIGNKMNNKYLVVSIVTILLFSTILQAKENSFKTIPEKPKVGNEVTVVFNVSGTSLEKAENIDMYAYLYSSQSSEVFKIQESYCISLQKSGNEWSGKVKSLPSTDIIGLIFENDGLKENNEGKGYFIKFYDANGIENPSSVLGYAAAKIPRNWGESVDIVDPDKDNAFKIMDEVFTSHPELKLNYLSDLASLIQDRENPAKSDSLTLKLMNEFKDNLNLNEQNYSLLAYYYGKIGKTDLSNKLKETSIQKFPYGDEDFNKRNKEFLAENNLVKKIDLAFKIDKDFHGWFLKHPYNVTAPGQIFKELVDSNKYDLLKIVYERILASKNDILFYQPDYLIGKLIKAKKQLDIAIDMCRNVASAWQEELKHPTMFRVKFTPESVWNKNLSKAPKYTDMLCGEALLLTNKHEEALAKFESAYSVYEPTMVGRGDNELYLQCLAANQKFDKAKSIIEELVKKGLASDDMIVLLKEIYVKNNGNEKGYDEYVADLQSISNTKLVSKLKKEMINEPAPQFTLTDLNGKEVSLADFKGSIVIVDFWATWCGPCKASFPGMQKAVEKYSTDKSVKFLFVNAWQTEENKKQNAEKFIKEKKYSFHVLLDNDNKVITSYKVEGIPTKFIVDKNGNIRFKVVGGDPNVVVSEVSAMIELAGK